MAIQTSRSHSARLLSQNCEPPHSRTILVFNQESLAIQWLDARAHDSEEFDVSGVRQTLLIALVFGVVVGAARGVSGSLSVQNTQPQNQNRADFPPILWTCQTRPDILEDRPGPCPIDEMPGMKMPMVPVRLTSVWSCPVHAVVAKPGPGKCPIDHVRDLVEVGVSMSWTCSGHDEVERIDPGTCPDGSPMAVKYSRRPHGNHNPQHGGQFFMAADNWHHLEGVYPVKGVFRLYVYDDYGKPLAADAVRLIQSRVVTRETFDSATRSTRELRAYPLVSVSGAGHLEATIDPLPLPVQLVVKVKFRNGGPEYRFDFSFAAFTKEPGSR